MVPLCQGNQKHCSVTAEYSKLFQFYCAVTAVLLSKSSLPASPIPSQRHKHGKGLKYVEQQVAPPLNLISAITHGIALQCCAPASDSSAASPALLASDPS